MKLFGLNIERREAEAQPKGGAQQSSGQDIQGRITYANGERTSLSISAFYRALTLRAETMMRLKAQYQRKTTNGNYTLDMGYARGKRLNYLLQVEPNPYMGWPVLYQQADIIRMIKGNAYIYVERGLDDEVKAFWLCSSGNYLSGQDAYSITYQVGSTPYSLPKVPSRNIIHLRGSILMPDLFTGMPLIHFASRTLNLAATQEAMALDTYAKGGRNKLLLQEQSAPTMGLGKPASKEMEKLSKRVQEDLPANDVIYVPNTAQVNNISQTLGELELTAARKLSVADISRFTGVPKALLSDDSNSTYKTPEAAMLDFFNSCIAPQIEQDEAEFNRKLLGFEGFGLHRFHLCEDHLFRLDRQAQALWNKNRMETGVVSINELRAEMEMDPIAEGGDDHYVSANYIKAGSPKLSGETAATPPPSDPDDKKKGGAS